MKASLSVYPTTSPRLFAPSTDTTGWSESTWADVTSKASDPTPFLPPVEIWTSQRSSGAVLSIVMLATTSVELTKVVELVRTCPFATPWRSHVACASAPNPEPRTCTSIVVPRSPKLGLAEDTAGPAGALALTAMADPTWTLGGGEVVSRPQAAA